MISLISDVEGLEFRTWEEAFKPRMVNTYEYENEHKLYSIVILK
jgi:hypothetical protein